MKTNFTRILDDLGVRYTLLEYQVDPADLTAETVAAKIGLPAEQVFKTLVARGAGGAVYLAIIPAHMELDGKALARATGDRRVDLVPLREVQQLTGYIRGGVTALGGKRDYPVYADESIELFHQVALSAGTRGVQVLIAPADYLRITHATVVAIARQKHGSS